MIYKRTQIVFLLLALFAMTIGACAAPAAPEAAPEESAPAEASDRGQRRRHYGI